MTRLTTSICGSCRSWIYSSIRCRRRTRPWWSLLLVSRVRLFMTPWTVASKAPPPMGFSRRPLQPMRRQGQQGIHPAGGGRPPHRQLPVQPQRGDRAVRRDRAHGPGLARRGLPPRADGPARGPVHAALLPVGQRPAPKPGPDLPGRLLLSQPGGRGPQLASGCRPGDPPAEDGGPTAALTRCPPDETETLVGALGEAAAARARAFSGCAFSTAGTWL